MTRTLSGLRAWLVQRFTAVYMLGFSLFLLFHFAVDAPHSYEAWRGWILDTPVLIATALFFVALLLHAWVGLRDVALDYVKPLALRVGVLAALAFGLAGLALWMLRILLFSQH
ncbi:MAG: succinate dehydrogenase, hydrophobic membrane anchor protein [Polaromonas sp.]